MPHQEFDKAHENTRFCRLRASFRSGIRLTTGAKSSDFFETIRAGSVWTGGKRRESAHPGLVVRPVASRMLGRS